MVLVAAPARRNMKDGDAAHTDLIRRLAQGDAAAVETLYSRFGRSLYAYVRSIVRDDGLAEEVVQDTFVAAWRGAAGYESRASLSSWLFGIARRRARDRMRRVVPPMESVDVLIETPGAGSGPELAALATASREALTAALRRIPPADREVLLLAFAHELSGPEIAEVLGIPVGTVKSRLFNARRRMRDQLVEEDLR